MNGLPLKQASKSLLQTPSFIPLRGFKTRDFGGHSRLNSNKLPINTNQALFKSQSCLFITARERRTLEISTTVRRASTCASLPKGTGVRLSTLPKRASTVTRMRTPQDRYSLENKLSRCSMQR